MKRSPNLWASLLFCLVPPSARAEPGWTFTWTSPDTAIFANSLASDVRLFPGSGHGSGGSDIVAANLQAISSAPANTPDSFTAKGYTLNLRLTDDASGASGELTFTGHFDGSLSSQNVRLANTFDRKTGTLNLGGHEYAVTLGSYNPPGLPGSTLLGAFGGVLSVDDGLVRANSGTVGDPPLSLALAQVHKAPEPSSLMLAALGLSTLSLGAWRRSRKHRC